MTQSHTSDTSNSCYPRAPGPVTGERAGALTPGRSTYYAGQVRRYGGPEVIELVELPRPSVPPGWVRIAVEATPVTAGDSRVRAARVPTGMRTLMRLALGWSGPRQGVLGVEAAGVVTEVGAGVTAWRPGDAVLAVTGARFGAHAEELLLPADAVIVARPAGLGAVEAAALAFGGLTATHYLRAAAVKPGERVLVIGASGAVGTAFVQLARREGAEVTGICGAQNAELVRQLGARETVDYRQRDVFSDPAETRQWDVIIDAVGETDYSRARPRLAPGGRLVRVVCGLLGQLACSFQGRLRGHRVIAGVAGERREDVVRLCDLAARGELQTVVDRVYPLSEIRAAHERVDSGRKRGSVVLVRG